MSLSEVLKNQIGKKACVVHDEKEKVHTIVGIINSVTNDALVVTTDFGVRNIIPLKYILKIKEVSEKYDESI